MAAGVTGGPGGSTHLISNYTKENNCRSLAVERSALDILESALISAESFIRVHKQKEKNQIEREIMASGTKLMATVARRSVSGKTVPSVLSTAQGLKTSATVYPNEDRPRLMNQSDFRISEFVTEPSDKKETVISSTHEENGFMFPFTMRKYIFMRLFPRQLNL